MRVRFYTDHRVVRGTLYLLEHDYFDKLIQKVHPNADMVFVVKEVGAESWFHDELDIEIENIYLATAPVEIIVEMDDVKIAELLLKIDGYFPSDAK